jgi:hypothetical protein
MAAVGVVLLIVLGTGLWPIAAPKVERIVPLTNDGTNKLVPLVADGNRVVYCDEKRLWAIPTSGGDPKSIPLAFLPASRKVFVLYPSSPLRQRILLPSWPTEVGSAELWLAGLDGDAPLKAGELSPPFFAALAPGAERIALNLPDGVYIQSVATGERTKIRPMQRKVPSYLWWHPSGQSVGFLDIPGERSKTRAWQVNVDGTHLRRIVPEREQGQGAGGWSADGKRFYYCSLGESAEIFVRTEPGLFGWMRKPVVSQLTTSGQFGSWPTVDPVDPRRLYVLGTIKRGETMRYDRRARKWVTFLGGLSAEDIDRSPDGQWMAYVKFPASELHKCRLDGSGDIALTSGVLAINPHWSPDGKRIAFAGHPAATNEIWKLWLVSADGGDAAPYHPEIESGFDTIWSRDGKRILMGQTSMTLATGESRVKVLHLETGEVEEIPGGERIFSPRWSPDEKQLCGLRIGNLSLNLFDPAKNQWRELSKNIVGFPIWSSDGKYIYVRWQLGEIVGRVEVATGRFEEIARLEFGIGGKTGNWVGWTEDWDPLVLRDFSSVQVFRIDLDR